METQLTEVFKIIPKYVWIGDFYPLKDQADHRSNNLCYLNFGWLDKKNVTTAADKKLATQRGYMKWQKTFWEQKTCRQRLGSWKRSGVEEKLGQG